MAGSGYGPQDSIRAWDAVWQGQYPPKGIFCAVLFVDLE
jgi:hypothetical protein